MRRHEWPISAGFALLAGFSATSSALAAPPKIQTHTCANGLEVLVVENHAVPLVTIEIAAKNGSMTEPPEFNGLSHLYEHMFFKANSVIPSQEAYLKRMRELGMTFNGTTNTERVNYFFTTTSDHLGDSMVFMRDAITSPLFDKKELERERVVVTGEMDRNEASPFYHLSHEVDQHVWYKYPTRKDPLGSRKTVLSATAEKMRTIQHLYYVPNNSALVVTGDVSAADIFAQADKLYGTWKKAEDPFKKHPLVTHPALKKSEVVVVEKPVKTFVGTIVWHGPSIVPAELDMTYAADVFGRSQGEPSSRFQKALVDSGACVSAQIGWYTQKNVGPITISFQAAPSKIDACVTAVFAEAKKMAEPGYATPEELKAGAHDLEIDQVKEREKPSALAHVITFWWASAGLDYYLHYGENVEKVTPADATRFVTTYMLGKPFVFGALLSPDMAKSGATAPHLAELAGIGAGGAAAATPKSATGPVPGKTPTTAPPKPPAPKDVKKGGAK
jgi:zinc protease